MRARSLSLCSPDLAWQPVMRVLSYAYSACLRPAPPPPLPHIMRPSTRERSGSLTEELSQSRSVSYAGEGANPGGGTPNWRRWLATVGEGDNLAPVWLSCPPPLPRDVSQRLEEFREVGTEVEASLLAATAVQEEEEVMGVSAIRQTPREEGDMSFIAELDEVATAEGLLEDHGPGGGQQKGGGGGPRTAQGVVRCSETVHEVEGHMERMCNKARGGGGVEMASQVLMLLSPNVYAQSGEIGWGLHVLALSTMAEVCTLNPNPDCARDHGGGVPLTPDPKP